MNINLNSMVPESLVQMSTNMGVATANANGNTFMSLLDSLMAENLPGALMETTTAVNPDASVNADSFLQILGQDSNLSTVADTEDSFGEIVFKDIESTEQDEKDTDDNLAASIGVISPYLSYLPRFETEGYEVLKADDSVRILNDLINQSKPKTESAHAMKAQEQQNQPQEKVSMDILQTEFTKENSTYAEKLITHIENSRNKLKDEIDFNAGAAQKNRLMFSENKIIQVSDESSHIKSSAISQIKDKIELMVHEGINGTKEVTMELKPENLGKVSIKMFYEGNKLTVEIKALSEETNKLLMSNSQDLAKLLNKTMDSNVNVVVKHESAYAHNPLDYNQDKGQNQQKNNYTYSGNNQDDKDEDMFSQIMNSTA